MKREMAIEIFKKQQSLCLRENDWYKALTMAIEALEKQIPKKVFYQGDGYADGYLVYDEAQCPSCESGFEESDMNWETDYCPHCGQSLDWSVETLEEDE